MDSLGVWLVDGAFHAPLSFVAVATLIWFAAIYALIAGGSYVFAINALPSTVPGKDGRAQRLRTGQLREELLLSAASIIIFAMQAVALVWMLRAGRLAIGWDRPLWSLAWELPVLYLWNEIHFFAIHRLLHWPPLYRRVHVWHHRSVITTPFTSYSFHPVESFLLGTVMPLALVFHAFSPWSLLGLTVMSLLLNVSGHLPTEQIRLPFAFATPHSRYHNRHHREFHTHFAFSLPWLDRWLAGGPPNGTPTATRP
jgi:sterol desaturase/sphingolipid hydroxylase (fatty acid hydroxylase superfamily)